MTTEIKLLESGLERTEREPILGRVFTAEEIQCLDALPRGEIRVQTLDPDLIVTIDNTNRRRGDDFGRGVADAYDRLRQYWDDAVLAVDTTRQAELERQLYEQIGAFRETCIELDYGYAFEEHLSEAGFTIPSSGHGKPLTAELAYHMPPEQVVEFCVNYIAEFESHLPTMLAAFIEYLGNPNEVYEDAINRGLLGEKSVEQVIAMLPNLRIVLDDHKYYQTFAYVQEDYGSAEIHFSELGISKQAIYHELGHTMQLDDPLGKRMNEKVRRLLFRKLFIKLSDEHKKSAAAFGSYFLEEPAVDSMALFLAKDPHVPNPETGIIRQSTFDGSCYTILKNIVSVTLEANRDALDVSPSEKETELVKRFLTHGTRTGAVAEWLNLDRRLARHIGKLLLKQVKQQKLLYGEDEIRSNPLTDVAKIVHEEMMQTNYQNKSLTISLADLRKAHEKHRKEKLKLERAKERYDRIFSASTKKQALYGLPLVGELALRIEDYVSKEKGEGAPLDLTSLRIARESKKARKAYTKKHELDRIYRPRKAVWEMSAVEKLAHKSGIPEKRRVQRVQKSKVSVKL